MATMQGRSVFQGYDGYLKCHLGNMEAARADKKERMADPFVTLSRQTGAGGRRSANY